MGVVGSGSVLYAALRRAVWAWILGLGAGKLWREGLAAKSVFLYLEHPSRRAELGWLDTRGWAPIFLLAVHASLCCAVPVPV